MADARVCEVLRTSAAGSVRRRAINDRIVTGGKSIPVRIDEFKSWINGRYCWSTVGAIPTHIPVGDAYLVGFTGVDSGQDVVILVGRGATGGGGVAAERGVIGAGNDWRRGGDGVVA